MSKRFWPVVVLVAVVLALGMAGGIYVQLKWETLAYQTFRINGDTVQIRIYQRDDGLYASAREQRSSGSGRSTGQRIGELNAIGRAGISLLHEAQTEQIVLSVGTAKWLFNPETSSFARVER